ncbi:hypothetical protein chiPu_0018002 [Chiloscyllium punctatum]|uniref:Uncharacterized protein n=1 Tax=Chiloscyllium punctatum TaxID=137246 RepID=A0A401RKH3_CHIPU|nr:hypothetical protein [Chiloscyllium punctatum]
MSSTAPGQAVGHCHTPNTDDHFMIAQEFLLELDTRKPLNASRYNFFPLDFQKMGSDGRMLGVAKCIVRIPILQFTSKQENIQQLELHWGYGFDCRGLVGSEKREGWKLNGFNVNVVLFLLRKHREARLAK